MTDDVQRSPSRFVRVLWRHVQSSPFSVFDLGSLLSDVDLSKLLVYLDTKPL